MNTEPMPSTSNAGTLSQEIQDVPGTSQNPSPQAPKKHRCSKCGETFESLIELGEHVLVEINGGVTSPPFPYPYKYDIKRPVWAFTAAKPRPAPVLIQVAGKTPARSERSATQPQLLNPQSMEENSCGDVAPCPGSATPPEWPMEEPMRDQERNSVAPSTGPAFPTKPLKEEPMEHYECEGAEPGR